MSYILNKGKVGLEFRVVEPDIERDSVGARGHAPLRNLGLVLGPGVQVRSNGLGENDSVGLRA